MTAETDSRSTMPLSRRRDDALIEERVAASFVGGLIRRGYELNSFLIAREDAVLFERHWWPARATRLHTLHSATKSLVGSAAGLAIAEGALTLDDHVVETLAGRLLRGAATPGLEQVTVRDLLTMRGGNASGISGATSRREKGSLVRLFLSEPISYRPGSHFVYSSATSHLLSAVVQESTGRTTEQYLAEKLFTPLGIRAWRWDADDDGVSTGGNGLRLTPEDLARFALVHANGGLWQGSRVLPAEWVREAGRRHVERAHAGTWNGRRLVGGDAHDAGDGYGYQFWVHDAGTYSAQGVFGQTALIDPVSGAVIVVTGALTERQHDELIVALNTTIVPVLRGTPADAAEGEDFLPDEGDVCSGDDEGVDSGDRPAQTIDGEYVFEDARGTLSSLILRTDDDGVDIAIVDPRGRHLLRNLYAGWWDGLTSVYGWELHHSYEFDEEPVLAHARWIRPDTLELDWRFPEMPFRDLVRLTFGADGLTLARSTNVNSGPTTLPTLTARRRNGGPSAP